MPTWIIYAIAAMFFAGLTSVIAKFGLKNVPADLAVTVRTSAVFVFIWINALVFRHINQYSNFTKRDILFLCISGLTTSLSWIFYYRAIKLGNVSVVASIDKGSLVITILLAFFFLNEPITPKVLLGAGLIIIGTMVLIF
ncbi:MAG TPA: EamA family transporter [Bacteroidia bacterium]|nr:EamA family transporter [Bacteroidia bacterium]HRH07036.1 EamA family transporter [Bacteroidia bacterium]HRH64356.1 EamA family transporter [Bacteroidia bacterium]